MLDIFNHLAVFGILFVVTTLVSAHYSEGFDDWILCIILSMILFTILGEILAWSIYYLSGAGV